MDKYYYIHIAEMTVGNGVPKKSFEVDALKWVWVDEKYKIKYENQFNF